MGASRRDFLKNSGLMVMAGAAGYLSQEQWLRGADAEKDFMKKFEGKTDVPGGTIPGKNVSPSADPAQRSARLESPTIVTIFLRGGADSLNAWVPYGDDGYYKARPRIAIPVQPKNGKAVIKLDKKMGNDYFGMNPYFAGLQPLIDKGHCVPILNVGSPDGTRSHFSAQDYMERGTPGNGRTTSGWLNRYLALTKKQTDAPLRGLSAQTLLPRALRGPYPVLAGGNRCDEMGLFEDLYAPNNLINQTSRDDANMEHGSRLDQLTASNKPKQFTSESARELIAESGTNAVLRIKALEMAMATQSTGDYPGGGLGHQLRTIAQVIKANVGLEVAQAEYGGWDHHSDQGDVDGRYSRMLKYLSDCIVAFHTDLGERMNKTIVLVMTEFGRTVQENGSNGTDHGRGGYMLAVSGALNGGKMYGSFEPISQAYQGRYNPVTTDYRAVMAETIMKLFNVDPIKAGTIFPGYKPAAKDYLNFMKQVKLA
jgi:uncharacterized protein (DUF1501 family)